MWEEVEAAAAEGEREEVEAAAAEGEREENSAEVENSAGMMTLGQNLNLKTIADISHEV